MRKPEAERIVKLPDLDDFLSLAELHEKRLERDSKMRSLTLEGRAALIPGVNGNAVSAERPERSEGSLCEGDGQDD